MGVAPAYPLQFLFQFQNASDPHPDPPHRGEGEEFCSSKSNSSFCRVLGLIMGIISNLLAAFSKPKDLVTAYGAVLERHPGPIESTSLLPASKKELKIAILKAAMTPAVVRNEKMMSALHMGFLSLANFQDGASKAIEAQSTFMNAGALNDEALVDSIANIDMDSYDAVMSKTMQEQRALQIEWEAAFDLLAQTVQANYKKSGVSRNAPR